MSKHDDYNFIFSSRVHEELKEKVNGGIFCRVIEDALVVKIINDDLRFQIKFNEFSDKVSNGWSVTHAVHEIMKSYKRFINSRYFK